MTTAQLIEKHQCAMKVLEAIRSFESRIEMENEKQRSFFSCFPTLIRKSKHRIEIQKACINRLQARYNRILNN